MTTGIRGCLFLEVALAFAMTAESSSATFSKFLDLEDRDWKAVAFSSALEGDWKGTLEYRDYSNDKRVILPTTLEARTAEDGLAAPSSFDTTRERAGSSKG